MYAEESFTTTIHSQGQPGFKQICRQTDFQAQMRAKQLLHESQSPTRAESLRQPQATSRREDLQQTCKQLSSVIRTGEGTLQQCALLELAKLLKEAPATEGYCVDAVKSVVNYFNKLAHKLQDQQQWLLEEEQRTEYLMLRALSAISQIISDKVQTEFQFPFTRSFAHNVLMVSAQLVGVSKRKRDIVRIVSVVLAEMSGRLPMLKEYDLFERFRQVLLENYKWVQDANTFNRFNRAIKRVILVSPLSLIEVRKHKLLETVARFTNTQTFVEVMKKMNLNKFVSSRVVVVDPNLHQYQKSAYT